MTRRPPKTIFLAIIGFVLQCSNSPGQCVRQWTPGSEIPMGLDGVAYASTTWDPDGPGPMPELLVVGGYFSSACDVFANSIAAWDGSDWHALGSGMDGEVWSVAVFQGQLIAGGNFTTAGDTPAKNIARWDGESWHPLGAGVGNGNYDYVYEMLQFNNELIVGGDFYQVGGAVNTSNIARWNGTFWSAMGSGLPSITSFGIRALCVFEGAIIAGGDFVANDDGVWYENIARWNGSSWKAMGQFSFSTYARDLIVDNGQLYAAGLDGNYGKVAKWTGSYWMSMGGPVEGEARCLAVHNGQLYLGGSFYRISFPYAIAKFLARWDGTAWRPVAPVPGNEWSFQFPGVHRFIEYQGKLVVCGNYSTYGGTSPGSGVVGWDGASEWESIGGTIDSSIRSILRFNGHLLVGGSFKVIGSVPIQGVARRLGSTWQPLGSGPGMMVSDLIAFRGDLIAGGNGGTRNIARWDGTTWQSMGPDAAIRQVRAFAVYQDRLIVGGEIQGPSGYVYGIASWNGTSWQVLGSYLTVNDFEIFRGELYAALSSGVGVYRWSGAAWLPISGLSWNSGYDFVSSLEVFQDNLIAGGSFYVNGQGNSSNVARWNGTQWSPLTPSGPSVDRAVTEVKKFGDQLIVAGYFNYAGGQPIRYIARCDGLQWYPLENGNPGYLYALFEDQRSILTGGGYFDLGNGKYSTSLIKWGPVGPAPVVTQQPSSPLVCENSSVSLRSTATGEGSLAYQWQKNGTDLADTPELFGTQTDTLVFVRAKSEDTGNYSCAIILNDCTQTASNMAALTVYPTNSADGNGDMVVNGRDIAVFVDSLTNYRPVAPATCAFDLTADGVLNLADVEPFVVRLLAN